VSPAVLVEEVADRIAARAPRHRLRVAVDAAPAAAPERLAELLVDPIRLRGRAVRHIPAGGFLRPASLRLEFGRTNPDTYYEGWLDEPGLRREVLDPLRPGGAGLVLPSLWDAARDRATRAEYVPVPPGGVVLVSGALLLGGALPFDFTVHCELSAAALARRTPPELRWTLPAFERYATEVGPAGFADVVIRWDDPRRPALVDPEPDLPGSSDPR
jgi:hypothetical protein